MAMNIYIDECGNTGDITVEGVNQQPFFVLSGVHIDTDLQAELLEIENCYRRGKRLQQQEIKSSNTYSSQVDFTEEIINKLLEKEAPIWCEIMDKKYYVVANLINFTILQIWTVNKLDESHKYFLNIAADYLESEFSIDELNPYLLACKYPTRENLRYFLNYFKGVLQVRTQCEVRDGFLLAARKLVEEINDPNDSFNEDQYFPIPDYTKKGKRLIMLPYVQGFSNLLARINGWVKVKNIERIKLIHDEQKQFDEILGDYKEFCESGLKPEWMNKKIDSPADFEFKQIFPLSFCPGSA